MYLLTKSRIEQRLDVVIDDCMITFSETVSKLSMELWSTAAAPDPALPYAWPYFSANEPTISSSARSVCSHCITLPWGAPRISRLTKSWREPSKPKRVSVAPMRFVAESSRANEYSHITTLRSQKHSLVTRIRRHEESIWDNIFSELWITTALCAIIVKVKRLEHGHQRKQLIVIATWSTLVVSYLIHRVHTSSILTILQRNCKILLQSRDATVSSGQW